MLNGLTLVATLGSFWLFLCAINDTVELQEQKSEQRREEYRKKIYAAKRQQWQINENRRALWAEVTNNDNHFN